MATPQKKKPSGLRFNIWMMYLCIGAALFATYFFDNNSLTKEISSTEFEQIVVMHQGIKNITVQTDKKAEGELTDEYAKKLFKKCGDGFVANEGCRFNYGHRLEVGDNVSWNAGCYIDTKGGVKMGYFAMLTEYVKIFTHSHSEHDHMQREYNGVEIGAYAKVYTNATILPGVKLGTGAVVGTGAIVTKSVDDFTLVTGIPAKVQRMRKFESENIEEMNQYMMKEGLFQK